MVADNPTDHHIFLKAFTGVSDLHSSSLGITARTKNGDIEIMSPIAFRDRYGVASEVRGEGMTLNAIRFAVGDIGHAEAALVSGGAKPQRHVGRLVVPPPQAFGATLIFETANKA
jgi:hypothetical protein